MPLPISTPLTWELRVDSKRDNGFNGFYDGMELYGMQIECTSGFTQGQDAYRAISEPVAPPAQMRVTFDNTDQFFLPEKTFGEKTTNGTFATWSGGNPSSWTVTGESGSDPEISQVSPEVGHGGGGTGACNFYTTGSTVSISQNAVTVHGTFKLTMTISKVTAGVIAVYCGSERIGVFGAEGVFTETFIAESTTIKIESFTASCDVTLDSISIIQTQAFSHFLLPGTLIRFRMIYNSTFTQLFIGKIAEGGAVYGINNKSANIEDQSVTVIAQDAMLDLTDLEYAPPLLIGAKTGEVIQRFFDDSIISWPYISQNWIFGVSGASELDYTTRLADNAATSIETGQTTLAFAGTVADNGRGVQALQYIRDVCMAEAGGRFYFDGRSGEWTFHDRHHDALLDTSLATIDVSICESAKYVYGDDLINSITLNYMAREVGAPGTVLYESKTNPIRVDGKTVRKITGRYLVADSSNKRIGGYDFLPINSPPSFSVSANQEHNLSATWAHSVTAEGGGSSVAITLDNQGTDPMYVFDLQFKGTPLIWSEENVSFDDPYSKKKYGVRTKQPLNIKMIDDPNTAFAICQYIVNHYSTPLARFDSLTFVANLSTTNVGHLQNRTIGDRITVTSSYLSHNSDYVIIGEQHSVDTRARTHKVTWYLKHLGREINWILDKVGKAELGINTYLGL